MISKIRKYLIVFLIILAIILISGEINVMLSMQKQMFYFRKRFSSRYFTHKTTLLGYHFCPRFFVLDIREFLALC